MCKVSSDFRKNLSRESMKTYEGLMENYLLIHNQGSIGVFRHKKKKQDNIVWNTSKTWEDGHSHFTTFQVAKIIANNIALNRKPSGRTTVRNLKSYIRIATEDYKYLKHVEQLIKTKTDKCIGNNGYVNVGKKVG